MYSLIRHVNKSILWSFPVSVYFRLASDSSEAFSRAFDILEMTDDGHLTSGTNRYFRSSILVNSDVQEFSLVRRPSGDFDAVTTRETSHGNNHVVSSFSSHSSVNIAREQPCGVFLLESLIRYIAREQPCGVFLLDSLIRQRCTTG